MVSKSKNIYLLAGVILIVVGIIAAIPSFLKENILISIIGTIMVVAGLILFGIAFGD